MAPLKDEVRARGNELQAALQELRQVVFDILTSQTVRRFVINSFLVCAFATFTYYLSIPAYAAFYHFYLPDQIVTVPLHLQYGYGANPFAVASLLQTSVKNTQSYDVDISLTLPHSPENLEIGNFMVGMLLLGDEEEVPPEVPYREGTYFIVPPPDISTFLANRKILHSATRPTRLPYRSYLASKASSLLRLPYYAVWPGSETNTITVRMAERVRFERGMPVPSSLVVEIQAGQALQVYEASVTLTAQLKGLRYFMYQYRLTAFMLFTGMFWVTTMMAFTFWFALPEELLPSGKVLSLQGPPAGDEEGNSNKGKGKAPAKKEEGELSDTERTFPSSSKQPALKFEGRVKQEGGEQVISDIPPLNPGAEADDEDDEDVRARDSGIGTSFSDNRSREGTRRRTSIKGS